MDRRFERGGQPILFAEVSPARVDLQPGARKLVDRQAHLRGIFVHRIDQPLENQRVFDLLRVG